ncbi:hypothetical protein GOODEAATRI_000044 [Goodea atripinnis]|uniref:Secreted protein n=1 Tax=Goodea atripinnis TaxID=208336 RepID=A0ABV0NG98_9TELE
MGLLLVARLRVLLYLRDAAAPLNKQSRQRITLNSELKFAFFTEKQCFSLFKNHSARYRPLHLFLVGNERANIDTQSPICCLTLLSGCLNTYAAFARSLIQHFPGSPFFHSNYRNVHCTETGNASAGRR